MVFSKVMSEDVRSAATPTRRAGILRGMLDNAARELGKWLLQRQPSLE